MVISGSIHEVTMTHPECTTVETSFMRIDSEDKENYQTKECDNAVNRALTENAFVMKANSQLIAKLSNMAAATENVIGTSEFKASRCSGDKIITLAKLEALESKQRAMDEMVTTLRESLNIAYRERDEAKAKAAALFSPAEEPFATGNDGGERNGAENWEQKYNQSSQRLVEVMYERDRLKMKCDEMQRMNGVETVFISKKKEDWEVKYEEVAEQLKHVTFERNSLREEINSKVDELLVKTKSLDDLAIEKLSMQKEIEHMKVIVGEHSAKQITMQLTIDSLQYKVSAIKLAKDVEVGNLQRELECANKELTKTSSEKDRLVVENESQRQQIHVLEADVAKLQATLEGQFEDLQEQAATAQASLVSGEMNRRQHIVDLEVLKTQLTIANESLNDMRVENQKLSEDLQTLQKSSAKNLSEFKTRIDCVETKNISLTSERDSLKLEHDTLQHQFLNLQSYVSQITAFDHVMESTEDSIEVVSSDHMQQAENEYLRKERDELMSKNDALRQKNDALEEKLSELTAVDDSASNAFKQIISELNVQLAEKDKLSELSTQQLQDFMKEASQEQDQLKSKIALLQHQLGNESAENGTLRAHQLDESVVSITNDVDEIGKQMELSKEDSENFRLKWEASASQVESLSKQSELLESQLEASKETINNLNIRLESSDSLIKTMEDKCDQFKSSIAELTAKVDEAGALVNDLQLENERHTESFRQQEERSNNEISSLENKITLLKAEYEEYKVEAEASTLEKLRSYEAKLESLCVANIDMIHLPQDRTFDDMIAMLSQELSKLVEASTSTAKQLDVAHKEISTLELAAVSLRNEYEAYRVEADAAAVEQVKAFDAKLEPIQNELSIKVKELGVAHDEKLVLEQQICTLSSDVTKFKMQNKGLLKAMDQLTKYM